MSSAVKTMQLQMERLQEEMAVALKMEQDKQEREHERSILAKPNMEFMKGVLDKASALREYYDASDPTLHWLHYAPNAREKDNPHFQSHYPAMKEWREGAMSMQQKIRSEYRQCRANVRGGYTEEDRVFNAGLDKKFRELQLEEREIQERERQESVNIAKIPGRKPPRHLLGNAPTETDIKFLESVYNMFNIQSEQIKALEAEIQELKKDK